MIPTSIQPSDLHKVIANAKDIKVEMPDNPADLLLHRARIVEHVLKSNFGTSAMEEIQLQVYS